jgi:hypothetical protein
MNQATLRYVLRDTCAPEDRTKWAPYGAGGAWRRRQIDDVLQRGGLAPCDMEPVARLPLLRKIKLTAKTLSRFGTRITWSRVSFASAVYSYAFYEHNMSRKNLSRAIILEWGSDPIAFSALSDAGFKTVVSLMAIGSLWRERPSTTTGPYPHMYLTEIDNLRRADAVFCISREEQWLLANLGIRAGYLPYFPDKKRETSLLLERAARATDIRSPRPEFLICATRGNTDTVESFREQVEWIRQAVPEDGPIFHVTGNQTESVREVWNDRRFVFHGTCPEETFISIKRRCRAICLHSQKGLGAVTRIPDMLLAGLVVISNGAAARSYFNMNGVHVYDTRREFAALLQAELPIPPAPERPVELEDEFLACLKKLL